MQHRRKENEKHPCKTNNACNKQKVLFSAPVSDAVFSKSVKYSRLYRDGLQDYYLTILRHYRPVCNFYTEVTNKTNTFQCIKMVFQQPICSICPRKIQDGYLLLLV